MVISIDIAPDTMICDLKKANADLNGRCFENCTIAVLAFQGKWILEYVVGYLTPPGYASVPHAWLSLHQADGVVFIDPTLQGSSSLWQTCRHEFIYDEHFRFSHEELLHWFRERYPDRNFSDLGIPDGPIRGPIINDSGVIS